MFYSNASINKRNRSKSNDKFQVEKKTHLLDDFLIGQPVPGLFAEREDFPDANSE